MATVSKMSLLSLSAAVLALAGAPLLSAEKETYEISAVAIQDGNQVLITVKIFQNKTDGNKVLLSAPRVLLNDGHHATVCMGTGVSLPGAGPKDGPDDPAIWEGLRVEFIKAIGQDDVVCLLTVFSKGLVVSAKAETVKVTPGRFEIQGSTTSPRPATRPRRESKVAPGRSGDTILISPPRTMTDQRGCVHMYDYDAWGRLTADRVTTTGAGVDATVLCIGRTYETLGREATIKSYDSSSTAGTVVNQVSYTYGDGWRNLTAAGQSHAGSNR